MVESVSTSWVGLALVVGPGGIGSAVVAELKRTCPDLKVLTAGRNGPPTSSLQLDLENDNDLLKTFFRLKPRTVQAAAAVEHQTQGKLLGTQS